MAREVVWGTPERTDRVPSSRRPPSGRVVGPLAGALICVFLLAFHAAGRREVASPGPLTGLHATSEARCQECHAEGAGVSDLRCQRCHDKAGGARHELASHVLFAHDDFAKAEAAPPLPCVACHVEHRGRAARLSAVDEAQCASCHFSSFARHPELRTRRPDVREDPGLVFSHEAHFKRITKEQGRAPFAACASCHPAAGRDLEPVSFERHCASCHEKEGSLGATDALAPADVETPQSVAEFQASGERIVKVLVRHRDDWVLRSLARLRGDLEPRAGLAERGTLEARLSRFRRGLARIAPPARLSLADLRAREARNASELSLLEARVRGVRPSAHGDWARDSLETLDAMAPDAVTLREKARRAEADRTPTTAAELARRRSELLAVLSAISDTDPTLRAQSEDLRRRLLPLRPGDTTPEALERARRQRLAEQARLRDEIALRRGGVPASLTVGLDREEAQLQEAIAATESRLAAWPRPSLQALPADLVDRKRASREALAAPCLTCHLLEDGALVAPAPAKPVLTFGRFPHQPHLAHASCEKCHGGIERSASASDLNLPSVTVCRECHVRGAAPTACLDCHDYHPPGGPP